MIRCMQLASLFATLLLSVGCARWSMRPPAMPQVGQHRADTSWEPEAEPRMNPLAALVSGQMQREPTANAPGQVQPVSAQTDIETLDLKNLDPSLAIARLTERQGEPREARRMYFAYAEKNPNHPLPYHRLGVMAAREAKYEEAERHFQRAMELGPPTVELLSDVGYLYYLLDRVDEAEQLLSQASQAEPANAMVHNNLALVQAAKGDFDRSLHNFRRVNDEAQSRANLAYSYTQHGELQKARSEYLKALTLNNKLKMAAKALLQVEAANQQRERSMAQAQTEHERVEDPLLRQASPEAQGHFVPARDIHNTSPQHAEQYAARPVAGREFEVTLREDADVALPHRRQQAAQSQTHPEANRQLEQSFAQMLMPLPKRRMAEAGQHQSSISGDVALASATEPVHSRTGIPSLPRGSEQPAPEHDQVVPATHFEPVSPPVGSDSSWNRSEVSPPVKSTSAGHFVTPVRALFGDLSANSAPPKPSEAFDDRWEQATASIADVSPSESQVRPAGYWHEEPREHTQAMQTFQYTTREETPPPPDEPFAFDESRLPALSGVSIGLSDTGNAPSNYAPARFDEPARLHVESAAPMSSGVEINLKDDGPASAALSDGP